MLVFALADAWIAHSRAPPWLGVALAVGVIAIQYTAGPWLIEWLMDIVWEDDLGLLPEAARILRMPRASCGGIW